MPTSDPAPAPVVWTLRRPNQPDATFAALGITRAVRRLKNAGIGTLELSFDRLKPTFAATTMPYQTPVQVFRDGQPWFSGVVTGRSPIVSGASETSRITISDPWRWLERTTFRQPGFFLLNPLAATDDTAAAPTVAGTVSPTAGLTTTVSDPANPGAPPTIVVNPTQILYGQSIGFVPVSGPGQNIPGFSEFRPATGATPAIPTAVPGAIVTSKTDPNTGAKTVAVATSAPSLVPVAAAVDAPTRTYATVVQVSSHVAVGQDDSGHLVSGSETIHTALDYCLSVFTEAPFQVGEIDPDIQVPAQEFNAQSCADVIRSVLEWARDTTAWMDHATTPPTLHIRKRADRATVALTSGDDPAACVASAALEPMPEQILTGVTLEYLRSYEQGGVTTPPYQQIDQAGFDPVGPGALVVSFSLSGAATTNADGSATSVGEDAPLGLAQRIFDSRNFLEWRGTVTMTEGDLANRPAWPGVCVNVMGIEDAWEAARVQVQASEEDVFSGATTLTLGPPDQLSPQGFLALARAAQRTRAVNPTTTTTRTDGPTPTPPTLPTDPTAPSNGGGGGGNGGGGGGGTGGQPVVGDPPAGPHDDVSLNAVAFTRHTGSTQASYAKRFTSAEYTAPGPLMLVIPAEGPYNRPPTNANNPWSASLDLTASVTSVTPGGPNSTGYDYYDATVGQSCDNNYTSGTLDLSGYSRFKYASAVLYGSRTISNADGSNSTANCVLDVTGYLGKRTNGFRVTAPTGTDWHPDRITQKRSGSVNYAGLRLVRR